MLPRWMKVRQKTAAVVESWGKFSRIANAGFHILLPWESKAGLVSLRIQELNVRVETKTNDDVFVNLTVAVQYFVMPDRIFEAFYELSNPHGQIESYVYDEVRAQVPNMKLDEVFQNKDDVANAVKQGLEETMNKYGYGIVKALVNDVDPDKNVKRAMNEINAAQRQRKAAEERGEAEKILRVKQAEAEAQSAILRGKGIAGQRKAIIDGLRQSVEEFQKSIPDSSADDVMRIVIQSQYFDTLKEVGAASNSNTLMIPHSPGAVDDIGDQITKGMLMSKGVPNPKPPRPRPKSEADKKTEENEQQSAKQQAFENLEPSLEEPDLNIPSEAQNLVDGLKDTIGKFKRTKPPGI